MFILMVVIFVLGYTAIALEHPIKVDKAASALLIGVLTWTVYILNSEQILNLGFSPTWNDLTKAVTHIKDLVVPNLGGEELGKVLEGHQEVASSAHEFVKYSLEHHLVEIGEILFFLLGAMTIVEVVDQHEGFKIITDKIKSTNKVKLLWILSIITFFMSAALDNLTTTIVLIALLRKIIADQKTRWFFASMVVLAANAGGAWSPIGDVTTIMLWIGGQVTAANIILKVLLPSLATMIVPLVVVSFTMKGEVERPAIDAEEKEYTTEKERNIIFIIGVLSLLFVPVFKTITHLPPYMGMLLGLGVLWTITELMHAKKSKEHKKKLTVIHIIKRVEVPTIFFFLGILSAVAALQSAGHLSILGEWLNEITNQNIYVINLIIGVLSSIVDNVPLVAGAMGMYDIADAGVFAVDGAFWEFLAYCAGTGGSILIIGSAAGVAAMGLEKIDFIWYLKKISLLALLGYLAGAGVFMLF